MMEDKCYKTVIGVREVFANLSDDDDNFIMLMDPDDLVSVHLAKHVHTSSEKCGWYFDRGYKNRIGSKFVTCLDNFDRVCGSCSIIRIAKQDKRSTQAAEHLADLLNRGHHVRREVMRQEGRPLSPLPFFGAVYTTATGDNWSGEDPIWNGWRQLASEVPKLRWITSRLSAEFPGIEGR